MIEGRRIPREGGGLSRSTILFDAGLRIVGAKDAASKLTFEDAIARRPGRRSWLIPRLLRQIVLNLLSNAVKIYTRRAAR